MCGRCPKEERHIEMKNTLRNRFASAVMGAMAMTTAALPATAADSIDSTQSISMSAENSFDNMRAMRLYSENEGGVGMFINLKVEEGHLGQQIGQKLQKILDQYGIDAEYRYIASKHGEATTVTFYVAGVPQEHYMGEIKNGLREVIKSHRAIENTENILLSKTYE